MSRIRVYGYLGLSQAVVPVPKGFTSDTLLVAKEPYLWKIGYDLNGAVPVQMQPIAGDNAAIVRVEVPDNVSVRYEFQPNGPLAPTAVIAGQDSPRLSGIDWFEWMAGATFSFVDAAAFP